MTAPPTGALISPEYVTNVLQRLVRIPSQYAEPDFSEHREILEFLADQLATIGGDVKLLTPSEGYPSLVGAFGPHDGKPRLAFLNHYHTVPAGVSENWSVDPFSGAIVGDRLYGRGSRDCKAGMAAALAALKGVLNSGRRFRGRILFLAVPGEGAHVKSHPALVREFEQDVRADWYLDGDGGFELRPVIGGFMWLKLTVTGRSGHSALYLPDGKPPVNANSKMVRVLAELLQVDKWMTYEKHPLFGPPRRYSTKPIIEVGILRGGTKVNIIPSECQAHLDIRMLPSQKPATVLEELGRVLSRMRDANPGLEVRIDIIGIQKPDLNIPPDDPLVLALKESTRRRLARELEEVGHIGSGKPELMKLGTLVYFGPGEGGNVHTEDEYVLLPDVVGCAKVYADIIDSLIVEETGEMSAR